MKFTVEMTKKEFDSLDEDIRQSFISNTAMLSIGNEELLTEANEMLQQLAEQIKVLVENEE